MSQADDERKRASTGRDESLEKTIDELVDSADALVDRLRKQNVAAEPTEAPEPAASPAEKTSGDPVKVALDSLDQTIDRRIAALQDDRGEDIEAHLDEVLPEKGRGDAAASAEPEGDGMELPAEIAEFAEPVAWEPADEIEDAPDDDDARSIRVIDDIDEAEEVPVRADSTETESIDIEDEIEAAEEIPVGGALDEPRAEEADREIAAETEPAVDVEPESEAEAEFALKDVARGATLGSSTAAREPATADREAAESAVASSSIVRWWPVAAALALAWIGGTWMLWPGSDRDASVAQAPAATEQAPTPVEPGPGAPPPSPFAKERAEPETTDSAATPEAPEPTRAVVTPPPPEPRREPKPRPKPPAEIAVAPPPSPEPLAVATPAPSEPAVKRTPEPEPTPVTAKRTEPKPRPDRVEPAGTTVETPPPAKPSEDPAAQPEVTPAPEPEPTEVAALDPPKPEPPAPEIVEPSSSPPEMIDRQEPEYPARARKKGLGGTVVLEVLVSETGRVVRVVVEEGIPGSELEARAIDAVLRSKFRPGTEDGKPVRAWMTTTYVFTP